MFALNQANAQQATWDIEHHNAFNDIHNGNYVYLNITKIHSSMKVQYCHKYHSTTVLSLLQNLLVLWRFTTTTTP